MEDWVADAIIDRSEPGADRRKNIWVYGYGRREARRRCDLIKAARAELGFAPSSVPTDLTLGGLTEEEANAVLDAAGCPIS
jgi:hypothetical protein